MKHDIVIRQTEIHIEVFAGTSIEDAVTAALKLSLQSMQDVIFTFNGVEVRVSPKAIVGGYVAKWENSFTAKAEQATSAGQPSSAKP